MKHFETPEMEIIRFNVEDIIATSEGREDEFPITPVGLNEFPISSI